jgi:L-lactate utilization protein LutB
VIAENGTIILVENEGNIRLSTTLPRVHIALVGIEKIIPKMEHAVKHQQLLARNATGQKISNYVSFIRAGRRPDERDGAKEFHLVFLDNGRSKMRKDPVLREALKCIRCGACLNACPVYQHIGGHAYGSVYPGPIGAMITHALTTGTDGWDLPFASSLCGACTQTCPANIPIHKILIELRRRAAQGPEQKTSRIEDVVSKLWSESWSRPVLYNVTNKAVSLGGKLFSKDGQINDLPSPFSNWTDFRVLPQPAEKSFHELWKTRQKTPAGENISSKLKNQSAINNDGPETISIEEIKKKLALPKEPRPGDPVRLMNEMKLMRTDVFIVSGIGEAREKLLEIFKDYSGKSLVKWDHPEILEIGVEDIAKQAGMSLLSIDDEAKLYETVASAEIGLTSVDYGLAATGTLVLMTDPAQEKSVSVLPPVHIALLKKEKILLDLPDLFTAIKNISSQDFRGMTFISGPSLTGDIEMIPVHGVHGPGKVYVVIF